MMNIESKKMKNYVGIIPYEQPNLKKFGSMKDLVKNQTGSTADGIGNSGGVDTPDDSGGTNNTDDLGSNNLDRGA